MPIHDWTRVDAGLFHDFHLDWNVELSRSLNRGRLPDGYSALLERSAVAPDEFASGEVDDETERQIYAARANRIRIQYGLGPAVAVIKIVSPGNKSTDNAIRALVEEIEGFIRTGVHVLVVDLFPPSNRDPQGIHQSIWDEFSHKPCQIPNTKKLTVAAYQAAPIFAAFVEPVAVGDELPSLPIFLTEEDNIPAPLEETYRASWAAEPAFVKELLRAPD